MTNYRETDIIGISARIASKLKSEGETNMSDSYHMPTQNDQPGKGAATGSLVCGIISVVLWFFVYSTLLSVILGIVGLVLSSKAKKEGFVGGMQTAGFVLSIIGLIGGALVFVACVACVGMMVSLYPYYGY